MTEPENQWVPDAVRVCALDGTRFGYVNRLQARAVLDWLDDGPIEGDVFRVNGRVEYPRLFVRVVVSDGAIAQAA